MFIYVFLISDFASDLLMVMSPDAREDHWLTWFPSIALTKIFNIFSYHNSDGVEPLIVYDLFNNSTLFPVLFGKIIISTLILILFTVYFEVTLTHKFGRYHDWLFFLTPSFYSKKKAQNDLIDEVSAEDSTNDEVLKEAHKATTSTSLPLRVVNLKHIYPGASTPAVKGVSFTARKGEILALIGSNGAGKSTTLSALSGLFTPTSGEAYLCGHSIRNSMSEIYKFLGVCVQHDALYKRLSARDHLIFFAKIKGYSKSEIPKLVEQALESINLVAFADREAGLYSGGMRRRLSLAISLLGKNSIVFLDEPTTGVDVANSSEIWKAIKKHKHNRTIILTSHSFEEITELADRVVIIDKGLITAVGTPFDLKTKYGSGYKLSITAKDEKINSLKKEISNRFPQALQNFELSNFVSFIFPLDISSFSCLFSLVRDLTDLDYVKDFSVGHSSLEEVFCSLTE
ncbi:hypothetical protein RCL1_007818 [Eukaryota sp. TZLM3-RCL]